MANINRILTLCLFAVLAVIASPGQAGTVCNPVVDPVATDTTLARTLSRIAEEYEFKLSLPESLDHPVGFKKSMTLQQLVKHLTRDMNTVLKHKHVADCATPVLTHLIVLPVGKETEHVDTQQSAQAQPVDYIYIDNMESYVSSVLAGKQKADLGRMTPEQREEFKMVRDALAAKPVEELPRTEGTDQTSGDAAGN
ncbi:MAG: hypothetical protein OEO19_20935 [Gammaproteobacteria bacterium]|nr:hypothetical protein [Gammaproteobacteria bacterium]MDH3448310.1 hypothetical protein [Gammaproteobacteria bacterium]